MAEHMIWAVLALLLLPGCATPLPRETVATTVVIAVPKGMERPGLANVEYLQTPLPLQAVRDGSAAIALVRGAVPAGYDGFPFTVTEAILMQGWLDPPLAMTRIEAEAKLQQAGPPGQPGPGALARGRLTDLRVGWQAVAVDGVEPTPSTVWSGEYPLGERLSVVYTGSLDGRVRAVLDALKRLAAKPPEPWARLTVAGDVMLARGVARAMREKGTLYPIDKVKEHLASADIAFANLESPMGVKGKPLPGKQIWFRAEPEAVQTLQAAGLDGVTVANNHIFDYDEENFLETLDLLEQAGIRYVGGGRNLAEALEPLVLEAKGVRVGFLGYSQFADLFFDWDYPRSFAATAERSGVPEIQEEWLKEGLARARSAADVVAVAFHWGDEFQNYPNQEQQRLARLAVDLGADLVLGYHPHAIQGFELYKEKFIVYSTGNFIMDRQDTDLARESMLLDFQISQGGVRSVRVHPVWIHAEQPQIMTGTEGERLLQKMRTISGWR